MFRLLQAEDLNHWELQTSPRRSPRSRRRHSPVPKFVQQTTTPELLPPHINVQGNGRAEPGRGAGAEPSQEGEKELRSPEQGPHGQEQAQIGSMILEIFSNLNDSMIPQGLGAAVQPLGKRSIPGRRMGRLRGRGLPAGQEEDEGQG